MPRSDETLTDVLFRPNAIDGDEGRAGSGRRGAVRRSCPPSRALARLSSFTSLCTTPRRPDRAPSKHFDEVKPRCPPRVSGDRRSEVKEEGLAAGQDRGT